MICHKCGRENDEKYTFCTYCGGELVKEQNLSVPPLNNLNINNENKTTFESNNLINSTFENNGVNLNSTVQSSIDNQTLNNNVNLSNNNLDNSNNLNNSNSLNEQANNQNIASNTVQSQQVVNQNIVNENAEQKIDTEFYGNDFTKKKKSKSLILIIPIIILAIIGGAVYYFSQPKNSLFYSISKYTGKLEKSVFNNYNSISTNFSLSFDIKDTSGNSDELFNILNNLYLSGKFEIDYDKKIFNLDYGSTYKNKDFLKGSIYNEKNKNYIMLNGIYDKYIEYDSQNLSSIYEKNKKSDYSVIYESIKSAIYNSIKNDYFTKSDSSITIDGKEQKVKKLTFNLNQNNYKNIVEDVFDKLKNDKKFVESLRKEKEKQYQSIYDKLEIKNEDLLKVTSEDIIKELDDLKNNFKDTSIDDKTKVNFYLSKFKNDLLKTEIELVDGKFDISVNDNKVEFNVTQNSKELLKLSITKSVENNNNVNTFNLVYDTVDLKVILKENTTYNKTILNKDITNSIKESDMSLEEQESIQNKLNELEGVKDFNNYLNTLLPFNSLMNNEEEEENKTFDGGFSYNTSIKNFAFTITVPKEFKAGILNNDKTTYHYKYEKDEDSFRSCEFTFASVKGYNSSDNLLSQMHDYYLDNKASNIEEVVINNINWKYFTYESLGTNYNYVTTVDDEVYLFLFHVNVKGDKQICLNYKDQIINSIRKK